MPENKKTIFIFTKEAGSNPGDLKGKLRFVSCTDINFEDGILSFNYKGNSGKGKETEACFNLAVIAGFSIRDTIESDYK